MSKVLAAIDEETKVVHAYYDQLGAEPHLLLGYVMSLGYEDGTIITNDFYKLRCGGVSKNSFLLIRQEFTDIDGVTARPKHLILARVLEPAATPLATDVARTYFELHKSHMPEIDVFTKSELQWSAMKVAVLGTFYDDPRTSELAFGGDIDSFFSPHMYAVYVPTHEMLETLVNAFVDKTPGAAFPIGHLRLTESLLSTPTFTVPVTVSPKDFIGSRTALFGKTRMGKSNTVKILVQLALESKESVGQIIFDPNGEYAYKNEQDNTSIYDLYPGRCVRYTLREKPESGVEVLKANFYTDTALGHEIIRELFLQSEGKAPDYLKPYFEWEALSAEDEDALKRSDRGAWTRYKRQQSMHVCVLKEAGFDAPTGLTVALHMNQEIRAALAAKFKNHSSDADGVPESVPLDRAIAYYDHVWARYREDGSNSLFKTDSGKAYFDHTAESMLTVLTGRSKNGAVVSGAKKFTPYRRYHSLKAGELTKGIIGAVEATKTVIVDLSNAPEDLQQFFSDMICRAVFNHQMEKFTNNALGKQYVQFYFEEAHNLFPKDDSNLKSIYNRLAKEGAKLQIGVVYSTQSIASLSPDLLKNTENFFIAHLNDDGEIRALTRFYEFRDVGADVQKTKSKGFVRMITKSHKFALPVQINKFGPNQGDA